MNNHKKLHVVSNINLVHAGEVMDFSLLYTLMNAKHTLKMMKNDPLSCESVSDWKRCIVSSLERLQNSDYIMIMKVILHDNNEICFTINTAIQHVVYYGTVNLEAKSLATDLMNCLRENKLLVGTKISSSLSNVKEESSTVLPEKAPVKECISGRITTKLGKGESMNWKSILHTMYASSMKISCTNIPNWASYKVLRILNKDTVLIRANLCNGKKLEFSIHTGEKQYIEYSSFDLDYALENLAVDINTFLRSQECIIQEGQKELLLPPEIQKESMENAIFDSTLKNQTTINAALEH